MDGGPSWKVAEKRRRGYGGYVKLTLSVPPALRERMTRAEADLSAGGTKPNWSAICQRAIGDFLAGIGR